eukprot:GILI01016366.1.p1 GENE.GILI01016366.1~~GILI01016366.1.p1  ORF type:complete len:254 (+),score=38.92 GILI01016366.1:79-762(+)
MDSASGNHIPWKTSLEKSITSNRQLEFSRNVSMATVNPDGTPDCRTLRFHTFFPSPGNSSLVFACDARTQKVVDINHQPVAEVCWYFPLTQEQFRVKGRVSLIGAEQEASSAELKELRLQIWRSLPDDIRNSFEGPVPGTPRPDVIRTGDLDKFEPQPISVDNPSENFLLMLLLPSNVDHVQAPPPAVVATNRPHQHESILQPPKRWRRWTHALQEDGTWRATMLNP